MGCRETGRCSTIAPHGRKPNVPQRSIASGVQDNRRTFTVDPLSEILKDVGTKLRGHGLINLAADTINLIPALRTLETQQPDVCNSDVRFVLQRIDRGGAFSSFSITIWPLVRICLKSSPETERVM